MGTGLQHKGENKMTQVRKFFKIREKSPVENGLTELNAADSVNNGFMAHSDWIGHIMRYGYATKVIEKRKPETVLDVGCGRLNLAKFLWRNRSSFDGLYVGADLRATEDWLEDAGTWKADVNLFRTDFVEDPSTTLPPAGVVVCFEVFEHVPISRQQSLLNRLFWWTEPGGDCLFSTPNAGVAKSTAENHIGSDGIRERTYQQKLNMVAMAGFEVVDAFGTFCGSTRLPKEFLELPHMKDAKRFLLDSFFVCLGAISFPEQSNNALFHLRRPA